MPDHRGVGRKDPGSDCPQPRSGREAHLLELLLVRPLPVVRRLQLGHRGGSPSGEGRASPRALLAAQSPGPAVAAEGLERLGLAREQGCGAQAGGARGAEPLLVLVVFVLLVVLLVPQIVLQLLLLLLLPFRLPGADTGRGSGEKARPASPPPHFPCLDAGEQPHVLWLPRAPVGRPA